VGHPAAVSVGQEHCSSRSLIDLVEQAGLLVADSVYMGWGVQVWNGHSCSAVV
jgi:hypothetical protein